MSKEIWTPPKKPKEKPLNDEWGSNTDSIIAIMDAQNILACVEGACETTVGHGGHPFDDPNKYSCRKGNLVKAIVEGIAAIRRHHEQAE